MKFIVISFGFITIGVIVLTLIICFLLMFKNWIINGFEMLHLLKCKDSDLHDTFMEVIISSCLMIVITLAFISIARLINETIVPYLEAMNLF